MAIFDFVYTPTSTNIDFKSRGLAFQPHWILKLFVGMTFSKTLPSPSLALVKPRKCRLDITERKLKAV